MKRFYKKILICIFAVIAVAYFGFNFSKPRVSESIAVKPQIIQSSQVVAGKPVRWIALISKKDLKTNQKFLQLPGSAENINVKPITEKEKTVALNSIQAQMPKKDLLALAQSNNNVFTASIFRPAQILFGEMLNWLEYKFNPNLAYQNGNNFYNISGIKKNSDYVEAQYETPAPQITQRTVKNGQEVTVKSPQGINYTNVLAFANLDEPASPDEIQIVWKNPSTSSGQATNQKIVFTGYDSRNSVSGEINYVEWTVPNLTTATFDIIVITKAEKLDKNKRPIEDVYGKVKAKDNIYANFSSRQYVRVTFKTALTNQNDITVFARPTAVGTSPELVEGRTPSIQVFPVYTDGQGNRKEGPQLLAVSDGQNPDFSNITANPPSSSGFGEARKYRILLKNLKTPTDVFDLKIIGGIDIDYIVDPAAWLSGWTYRKAISILNTNMSTTTLTDFPTLVAISSSTQQSTDLANALASGYDIRFTDSSGTTLIPYERESWTGGGGTAATANFWVKTTLNADANASTNDTIYMYYGKAGASDGQSATSVWSNGYAGVWHLKETGTNPIVYDSTSNTNNSTSQTWTPTTSGQIDGAGSFDGSSQYLVVPDNNFPSGSSAKTISFWLYDNLSNDSAEHYIFKYGTTNSNQYFDIETYDTGQHLYISQWGDNFYSSASIPQHIWKYVVVTVSSGGVYTIYINGAYDNSKTMTTNTTLSGYASIGAYHTPTPFTSVYLNGVLDETRIASGARDANWIKFEYCNQTNNDTGNCGANTTNQLTFASQEVSANWLSGWSYRKMITISNTNVGSADLPYFPLLVKISSDANFSSALADGYDIRFTDSNGTTLLPYERESWSGGKGSAATANFWVRVPTVLHSASTTIYVYYGNSADSDWTATTSTITNCTSITNAQCTWKEGATQNYLAVWHMKEAGTPATWNDSTANAINGTNYGATATTGQVNGGGSFVATGSNYFITPILPTVTAGITEEAWVKPNAAGGVIFSELGQAGINYGWHDSHLEVETNNTVKVCMWANSETCAVAGSGITYGQWYHMVMRYNTTGPELTGFINGVKGATNGSTKQYPGSLFYGIGATDITNGGDGSYFSGLLDEERISKVTRTDGWIKFEYCNQTIDTTNCDTGTNPYEISLASQESSASIFSIKGQMRVKGVMRIK